MVKLLFLSTTIRKSFAYSEKKSAASQVTGFCPGMFILVLVHLFFMQLVCMQLYGYRLHATPTIISLNYYMYYFDKELQLYWIWMDRYMHVEKYN